MSYAHILGTMYEICSYYDNGFIIDELRYIISSMSFIMTPNFTYIFSHRQSIAANESRIKSETVNKGQGRKNRYVRGNPSRTTVHCRISRPITQQSHDSAENSIIACCRSFSTWQVLHCLPLACEPGQEPQNQWEVAGLSCSGWVQCGWHWCKRGTHLARFSTPHTLEAPRTWWVRNSLKI